ncbi:MAG: hypothetical protein QXI09_03125 [Candidatus Aenigmatarchaeota archaeon]
MNLIKAIKNEEIMERIVEFYLMKYGKREVPRIRRPIIYIGPQLIGKENEKLEILIPYFDIRDVAFLPSFILFSSQIYFVLALYGIYRIIRHFSTYGEFAHELSHAMRANNLPKQLKEENRIIKGYFKAFYNELTQRECKEEERRAIEDAKKALEYALKGKNYLSVFYNCSCGWVNIFLFRKIKKE